MHRGYRGTTLIDAAQLDAYAKAMSGNDLDLLIEWKAGSNGVLRHYDTEQSLRRTSMQRQFTIELRVDFADSEKLPVLKKTLLIAARHALATARLISDNEKSTQVAIFSDDFFSGLEEIGLMDDILQDKRDDSEPVGDGVSQELAAAFNGK